MGLTPTPRALICTAFQKPLLYLPPPEPPFNYPLPKEQAKIPWRKDIPALSLRGNLQSNSMLLQDLLPPSFFLRLKVRHII